MSAALLPPPRPDYLPPEAFLGYKITPQGLMMRCCSWCPDKDELHAWAAKKGTPVTDGVCPKCYQRMLFATAGK